MVGQNAFFPPPASSRTRELSGMNVRKGSIAKSFIFGYDCPIFIPSVHVTKHQSGDKLLKIWSSMWIRNFFEIPSGTKIFNDLDSLRRKLVIAGQDPGLDVFMNKVYMTLLHEYKSYILIWKRDKNLTPSDLKNELVGGMWPQTYGSSSSVYVLTQRLVYGLRWIWKSDSTGSSWIETTSPRCRSNSTRSVHW